VTAAAEVGSLARCSGDGGSPAWFVASGSVPIPGALGHGDSGNVGLGPAWPCRRAAGCRGGRGSPSGTVQAPRPLGPLSRGTNAAAFREPEELRHSRPACTPSGFASLRGFHLSLLLAVEKASSRRGTNQITSQLMKIMGNKVLLEAAWLDSSLRVSLDLNR